MVRNAGFGLRRWWRGALIVLLMFLVLELTSGCLIQTVRSRVQGALGGSSTPTSPAQAAATPGKGSAQATPRSGPPNQGDLSPFAGSWRIYSSRLYYDQGGGGSLGTSTSRTLELAANGIWTYGTSSGKYTIGAITPEDWKRWAVDSYGPKRKITLSGWSGGSADGPVEESAGRVDFVWVIYKVGPPTVSAAGTAWLKFGR